MIHDDLVRQFERTPQPELSPAFSINLRRALRGAASPPRRSSALVMWAPRLYWIAALALLVRYWRPVLLSPLQIAVLAAVCAAVRLTWRQAARPQPLTRVLRQMLRQALPR